MGLLLLYAPLFDNDGWALTLFDTWPWEIWLQSILSIFYLSTVPSWAVHMSHILCWHLYFPRRDINGYVMLSWYTIEYHLRLLCALRVKKTFSSRKEQFIHDQRSHYLVSFEFSCKYLSDLFITYFWTLANWHTSVGELTLDIGETTSVVGELTRWRNDRLPKIQVTRRILHGITVESVG